MEFMGKWIIWSRLGDSSVAPVLNLSANDQQMCLYPAQPMDINDAVYNLYAKPNAAEVLVQSNCSGGRHL